MSFEYGQKVTYIEGETGNEYDAEIVGPILKVVGRKSGKNAVAGKAIIGTKFVRRGADGKDFTEEHTGKGLSEVETSRGERTHRECYTLRVDFGDDRFADISGVSPEGKNFNTYKKSFFKVAPVAQPSKPSDKKEVIK